MSEDRKHIIGGWDAARIVTGKFGGPLGVWNDKMGVSENRTVTEQMLWGTRLENAIREEFERRHGVEVEKPEKVVSRATSWLGGHPDGLIKGQDVGLEVKTSSAWMRDKWGEEFTDEIPEQVIVQCQWYMLAMGYPSWWVAALIGGNEYKEYLLAKDEEFQNLVFEQVDKFRKDHLLTEIPPVMDASDAAAEFLKMYFPEERLSLRDPTEEEKKLVTELLVVRDELAGANMRKEELQNTLKHLIGDHEGLRIDGGRVTWKKVKDRKSVDWQALAMDMKPTAEQLRLHTKVTKGYRRFNIYLKKN